MHRKIFYFLLFLALCPVLLTAGTKGRIKGKVVDLQTGEPLIGASVTVVGTSMGANTDAAGEFLLQNLDAGVYTLKASYVGYQTITISNIRVNADLTTYETFQLPSQDIQVRTVDIVAQKPIIQKDNTNAVRITSSEDIAALPVRGVTNIVSLSAGVVLKDGNLYIRGGRVDEVGYYLEGVSITNPVAGGRGVTLSQDAIEEIQVQSGGYLAEFGNANSGIVRTQLKSGGSQYKASVEYITDNIGFKSKNNAFDGKQTLGSYWWGYTETSASFSGPLLNNRVKFFVNADYSFNRDDAPYPWPGINLGLIGDPQSKDTLRINYPAGALQGRALNTLTFSGTINVDLKPVMVRLSGTYTNWNRQLNGNIAGNTAGATAVFNMFNTRKGQSDNNEGSFSAKVTHALSSTMFYEVSAGYSFQKQENYTPGLGSDIWIYGDSLVNANLGWKFQRSATDIANGRVGRYVTPTAYSFFGYTFAKDGTVPTSWTTFSRQNLSFSGALNFLIGKAHSFKIGGDYTQYTLRNWNGVGTAGLANTMNIWKNGNPGYTNQQLLDYEKTTLIKAGVNNFGYDVYGNKSDDGFNAPHKPVYASAYIQDRIEYEDLIINAGLRYDYVDIDNLNMVDPASPEKSVVFATGEIVPDGWVKVATFSAVSPRLGLSFPVTDKTMFHAQWGKFIQQPSLNTAYRGYYRLGFERKPGNYITTPVALDARPTRTTQYELGFTQQLTDFLSFDITGYYKDVSDEIQFFNQNVNPTSPYAAYNILRNGDYATTKGIEIALNMRRYNRLQVNANLSFQDARGTGSDPYTNNGVVGAPLDNVTVYYPQYVNLLSYNQSFKGNFSVDYRFGQNDGPSFLHEFGVSLNATFNNGHPYTQGTGDANNAETDPRFRQPIEALNTSVTPSNFQVDLRVDKTFHIVDKLALNIYVFVVNLFDTKNVYNVFFRTGTAEDDGYISNPELQAQLVNTYGQRYVDIYNALSLNYANGYGGASNGGNGSGVLYGPPRQIRLGIRLEY